MTSSFDKTRLGGKQPLKAPMKTPVTKVALSPTQHLFQGQPTAYKREFSPPLTAKPHGTRMGKKPAVSKTAVVGRPAPSMVVPRASHRITTDSNSALSPKVLSPERAGGVSRQEVLMFYPSNMNDSRTSESAT